VLSVTHLTDRPFSLSDLQKTAEKWCCLFLWSNDQRRVF